MFLLRKVMSMSYFFDSAKTMRLFIRKFDVGVSYAIGKCSDLGFLDLGKRFDLRIVRTLAMHCVYWVLSTW